MVIRLIHRTEFRYAGPVHHSYNEARLQPLDDSTQRLLQFDLRVQPHTPIFSYEERGGTVHHFAVTPPHERLVIEAESVVQTNLADPFRGMDLFADPTQDWGFYEDSGIRNDYAEWLVPTRYTSFHPDLAALARRHSHDNALAYLQDLNREVNRLIRYETGATHVHSTVAEVLRDGVGVCQDFAHVMLAIARMAGIPSRYVSGYLIVRDGEKHLRGELSSHAWVECLLPDDQWHGFDPTNAMLANDHYVKVHFGRDYADVAPTKGVYRGYPTESMDVSVRIEEAGVLASS